MLGDFAPYTKPPEAFTPELSAESVTLLAVGYTTVAPGGFHWQVSHLLERQLASLHDRLSSLSSFLRTSVKIKMTGRKACPWSFYYLTARCHNL